MSKTRAAAEALDFSAPDDVPPPPPKKRGKHKYTPRTDPPSGDELEELTDEQRYQAEYYRDRAAERSEAHARKWRTDPEYRAREINRMRRRRAVERAKRGPSKFRSMVESKRAQLSSKRTHHSKFVEVDGERQWAYGTSKLAEEVGRDVPTIRTWLSKGVLPGCSVWIGKRTPRAHFTDAFIEAVYIACERLYVEAGRGDLDVLGRLVRAALADSDLTYQAEPEGEHIRAAA